MRWIVWPDLELACLKGPDSDVAQEFQIFEASGVIELEAIAEGYTKWDGCSHWRMLEYQHFCDAEEAEDFMARLGKAIARAQRSMIPTEA